jgi:hypothetical protein
MVCFVNIERVDHIIYCVFQRFNLERRTSSTTKEISAASGGTVAGGLGQEKRCGPIVIGCEVGFRSVKATRATVYKPWTIWTSSFSPRLNVHSSQTKNPNLLA